MRSSAHNKEVGKDVMVRLWVMTLAIWTFLISARSFEGNILSEYFWARLVTLIVALSQFLLARGQDCTRYWTVLTGLSIQYTMMQFGDRNRPLQVSSSKFIDFSFICLPDIASYFFRTVLTTSILVASWHHYSKIILVCWYKLFCIPDQKNCAWQF